MLPQSLRRLGPRRRAVVVGTVGAVAITLLYASNVSRFAAWRPGPLPSQLEVAATPLPGLVCWKNPPLPGGVLCHPPASLHTANAVKHINETLQPVP
eukprot:m.144547 g.144547  ORF g.144547 m.144547 type:complete len:97 (-) comp23036_c0_seq2:155-445(-)